MELKVLILGWRNTGQGEHPMCKWDLELYSWNLGYIPVFLTIFFC